MKKLASELIFISQIKRDGSGVKKVSKAYQKSMIENRLMNTPFELHRLSMTEETFIAFNFNCFVVKIK